LGAASGDIANYLARLNGVFRFRPIIEEPGHQHIEQGRSADFVVAPSSEVEMSRKILIGAVSVVLLASTGLASAQTRTHTLRGPSDHGYAPYAHSYFDQWYWNGINGVAPAFSVPDRYFGTIWEGVAPY
jgi:hypothetical protein